MRAYFFSCLPPDSDAIQVLASPHASTKSLQSILRLAAAFVDCPWLCASFVHTGALSLAVHVLQRPLVSVLLKVAILNVRPARSVPRRLSVRA
jgi:hypothetical protein